MFHQKINFLQPLQKTYIVHFGCEECKQGTTIFLTKKKELFFEVFLKIFFGRGNDNSFQHLPTIPFPIFCELCFARSFCISYLLSFYTMCICIIFGLFVGCFPPLIYAIGMHSFSTKSKERKKIHFPHQIEQLLAAHFPAGIRMFREL